MIDFTTEELHLIRCSIASDLRQFHGPRWLGHEMHKCPENCFFDLQPEEIRTMQSVVWKILDAEQLILTKKGNYEKDC